MQLTPWFNGDTKPVRIGVYQQYVSHWTARIGYQYWDGSLWGGWAPTPKGAYGVRMHAVSPMWQNDPWRGLLK
jgi:hypothetical protein